METSKGFYRLSWLQRVGFGSGDLAQNLICQTVCTVLTSVRMFLANVGGLAVAHGVPVMVRWFSPDGRINSADSAGAWFVTMAIYAMAGLVLLVFCYSQSRERVVMDSKDTAGVRVSDLWVEFRRNRQLRVLAFFFITAFAMMAVGNSAGSYYMTYNVHAPAMLDRETLTY